MKWVIALAGSAMSCILGLYIGVLVGALYSNATRPPDVDPDPDFLAAGISTCIWFPFWIAGTVYFFVKAFKKPLAGK